MTDQDRKRQDISNRAAGFAGDLVDLLFFFVDVAKEYKAVSLGLALVLGVSMLFAFPKLTLYVAGAGLCVYVASRYFKD